MASTKIRSPDPRSAQAVTSLLKISEALFAERGIDNVSLREIATAAGSKNNNAVQYHFGSKEDLLVAIFRQRVEQMEDRRAEMIAIADEAGLMGDLPTLLEIVCLPHLDLTDEDGRHPYPSFLLQYTRRSWRVGDGNWAGAGAIGPHLQRTTIAMRETLAPLRTDVARMRSQLCTFMFLDALIRWDQVEADAREAHSIFVVDALSAAQAALVAGRNDPPRKISPFRALFPMLAL
ncbi:TetR/AcrR family transcriptional regulator [Sphingomonas crocodyli]|uniref:TetR/AcrR family transcriptional regulator n=1 Tax=Sphingomonas crocodyli TaxID=1979270 RepID=A0A437M912_9SPHN|nr:TetR/AcrR family transcriptional regulator [Sphingomonas crocodyli]RVT94182.1 TetR/AcrR family transcriptional regulator [Sphingomonas crocodyli]